MAALLMDSKTHSDAKSGVDVADEDTFCSSEG